MPVQCMPHALHLMKILFPAHTTPAVRTTVKLFTYSHSWDITSSLGLERKKGQTPHSWGFIHISSQTPVPFLEIVMDRMYTCNEECIIGNCHLLCVFMWLWVSQRYGTGSNIDWLVPTESSKSSIGWMLEILKCILTWVHKQLNIYLKNIDRYISISFELSLWDISSCFPSINSQNEDRTHCLHLGVTRGQKGKPMSWARVWIYSERRRKKEWWTKYRIIEFGENTNHSSFT